MIFIDKWSFLFNSISGMLSEYGLYLHDGLYSETASVVGRVVRVADL